MFTIAKGFNQSKEATIIVKLQSSRRKNHWLIAGVDKQTS